MRKIAGYSLMILPFAAYLAAIIPMIPAEELEMIVSCFAIAGVAFACVVAGWKLLENHP